MPRSGQTWNPARLEVLPPLEPLRQLLSELADFPHFPTPAELGPWVDEARQRQAPELEPLTFALVEPKPRRAKRGSVDVEQLYDARITRSHQVPCLQSSYHDLFNAVMFKAFPRAKRALHARQFDALVGWARSGAEQLPGRRTREQDALTLFDEGGSVVVCPSEIEAEFLASASLPLGRSDSAAQLVVFGHALVEHLSEGQRDLRSTARMLFVPEPPRGLALLELVDAFVTGLVRNPERFRTPDADAVVVFDREGSVSCRRFDGVIRSSRARVHPLESG